MKHLLMIGLGAVCLAGCVNSGDSVKQAAPLNPSGKPRNAKEQEMMNARKAAGDRYNAEMAAAAAKMKAAMAGRGGQ
jgi:hypothetical protein